MPMFGLLAGGFCLTAVGLWFSLVQPGTGEAARVPVVSRTTQVFIVTALNCSGCSSTSRPGAAAVSGQSLPGAPGLGHPAPRHQVETFPFLFERL